MKIGIDCRMWNETGMGRYIRNVVINLAKIDTENTYILFYKENPNNLSILESFEELKLPNNFIKVKANVNWHSFKEQFQLLFIFLRENLDILHIPTPNMPVLYPKKFLITIHDLTILSVNTGRATTLWYPYYLIKRLGFRINLILGAWRCKQLFTVSNYVKSDIINTLKVNPTKIILTPNAVDSKFYKHTEPTNATILAKYGITSPYLLYVGNAHPHKNLETLVQAYEKVFMRFPHLQLVLAGKKDYFYTRLEDEVKVANKNLKIVFPGYIQDNDLPILYSESKAFINPSMYEGFGIQILEAFACETKVISSNTTALKEIGEDVSYYFDPSSAQEMANTIIYALGDEDISRIYNGKKIAQKYNWTTTTNTIHQTYLKYLPK